MAQQVGNFDDEKVREAESANIHVANKPDGKNGDAEKILKEEQSRLDGILAEALGDQSLPKIMELFYTALNKQNWESLSIILNVLSKTIAKTFDIIPSLQQFAGKEEMSRLYAIFCQFTELLTATKKTLKNVTEQAKIQRESLEDLIENIQDFERSLNNNNNNNNNGSQFDKEEFNDSLNTLSQWISDKAVSILIKKWEVFCKQCQETYLKWDDMTKNTQSKYRNYIAQGLKIIGALGITAGMVIACVSAVVAAPCIGQMAAGAVGMAGLDVTGVGLVETIIGMAGVFGTNVCASTTALWGVAATNFGGGVGLFLVGKTLDNKGKVLAKEVLHQAQSLRDQLKYMLVFGQEMQQALNDFNDIKNEQISQRFKELENVNSRRRIKRAARSIIEYLEEYQQQGNDIVNQVEKAQKTMIAAWESS